MTTTPTAPTPATVSPRPTSGRRLVAVPQRRLPSRTAARAGVAAFVLFVVDLHVASRGRTLAEGPVRVAGLLLCCVALAMVARAPWRSVVVAGAGLALTALTGAFTLGGYAAAVAALFLSARVDRRAALAGAGLLAGFFALGGSVDPGQGWDTMPSFGDPPGALWLLAGIGAAAVALGAGARRRPAGPAGPPAHLLGRAPVVTPLEVLLVAAVVAVTALRAAPVFATPAMTLREDGRTADLLSPLGTAVVLVLVCVALSAAAVTPWFPRGGFAVAALAHAGVLAYVVPVRVVTLPALSATTVAALYVLTRAVLRPGADPLRGIARITGPLVLTTAVGATLSTAEQVGELLHDVALRGMSLSDVALGDVTSAVVAILMRTWASAVVLPLMAAVAAAVVTRWLADRERLATAATREAAAAERTRIARELHDVVAHHVSLVTVRAEAAPFVVPDLPAPARDAFADIASTSRRALDELRDVLGVLGRGDDPELAPQPTLADVPGLVTAARDAGADVRFDGLPDAGDVPAAVALAAHAVVREGLSNARRHAPGAPVTVALTTETDSLVVEVSNPAPGAGTVDGLGLAGLRERASAAGGTLTAGAGDGRFAVVARLPLRRPDVA